MTGEVEMILLMLRVIAKGVDIDTAHVVRHGCLVYHYFPIGGRMSTKIILISACVVRAQAV